MKRCGALTAAWLLCCAIWIIPSAVAGAATPLPDPPWDAPGEGYVCPDPSSALGDLLTAYGATSAPLAGDATVWETYIPNSTTALCIVLTAGAPSPPTADDGAGPNYCPDGWEFIPNVHDIWPAATFLDATGCQALVPASWPGYADTPSTTTTTTTTTEPPPTTTTLPPAEPINGTTLAFVRPVAAVVLLLAGFGALAWFVRRSE